MYYDSTCILFLHITLKRMVCFDFISLYVKYIFIIDIAICKYMITVNKFYFCEPIIWLLELTAG